MLGKRIKRIAQAAVFFTLLFVCVFAASHVLERKESAVRYGPFLKEPAAYDVIFLGNSHIMNAVYPMELWHDYGIPSFNLSCGASTMASVYWTMRIALDSGARPQVAVIDVDEAGRWEKAAADVDMMHTALDAFPLTPVKAAAIEDLVSGEAFGDIKWEFYFKLGKYHERWKDPLAPAKLSAANLSKGAEMNIAVAQPREYEIAETWDYIDRERIGYQYLRQTIELCQENGIEVLLTHVPFPPSTYEQEAVNAAPHVAREYGLEYLDFVEMDSVVDYTTDLFDNFSHLNPSGARKVTDYIGQYLVDHFDLPDRRGDAAYAAWDADYTAYAQAKLDIIEGAELPEALMLLHDEGLSAAVAIPRGSALYGDGILMNLLQNIARDHLLEYGGSAAWSSAIMPLEQLELAQTHEAPYLAVIDRGDGTYDDVAVIERLGVGADAIETTFGTLTYRSAEDGQELLLGDKALFEAGEDARDDVRIAVFDSESGEVLLVKAFDIR